MCFCSFSCRGPHLAHSLTHITFSLPRPPPSLSLPADTKISTNSFELDDLCTTLTDMIENKNARPAVTTVALLKVLSTLAKRYSNVLYDKKWLRSMLSPLFQSAAPKFSKMHATDVSLYLQCLVAAATLAECQPKDNDLGIFAEKSVQYLVGMSIRRGNAGEWLGQFIGFGQLKLALMSPDYQSNIFFSRSIIYCRAMQSGFVLDQQSDVDGLNRQCE